MGETDRDQTTSDDRGREGDPLDRWSRKRLATEVQLLRAQLEQLTKGPSRPEPNPGGAHPPRHLETVSVPEAFAAPFVVAHEYVERYFRSLVHRPREATIAIAGERYILLRAASMSVEFIDLVTKLYQDRGGAEARNVANNLLFDVAHALGRADALSFHQKMGVTDPIAKLSAGPIHFAFSGWAFVDILPESKPSPDEDYFLIYDHPFSFESHSWLAKGRSSDAPVCIMNAGYSSGWCEESFGLPLVSAEIECVATGAEHCRFIMAPPSRIEGHLERYGVRPRRANHESHRQGPQSVSVPEFFQRRRLEDELRRANTELEQRVEERTAALVQATDQLRLLASAVDNAVEGIVILTAVEGGTELRINSVNRGFCRVTGLRKQDLIGQTLDCLGVQSEHRRHFLQLYDHVTAGEAFQAEIIATRPDGSDYALELHVMPADQDEPQSLHWIGIFRDVTQRRRHVAELRRRALSDTLTELPNRALLFERLSTGVAVALTTGSPLALMVIDLDGFKEVNDTFGHHAGDVLLRQVGPRLRHVLRGSDTVARLGGDEFAVLLPDIRGETDATLVARSLLATFEEPFVVEEQSLVVGASIGLVLCPEHGEEASALLRCADVAMYSAKEARVGFAVYRAEHDTFSPARLALINELRTGIERDELVLHYQPQVALASGEPRRVEALVRWQHPEQGLLPPYRFIPFLEPGNLVEPLSRWVLERAIRDCAAWRRDGFEVGVSVNITPRFIRNPELAARVRAWLDEHTLEAAALTLEVTESGLLGDPDLAVPAFQTLREMGLRLSIDDFGTGYSSLAHLRKLPVDEIKIDRSFVTDMLLNEHDAAIVKSTIQLGKNLGRELVAEGIESLETLDHLAQLGCELGQGYCVSRPLPVEELRDWLAQPRVRRDPT